MKTQKTIFRLFVIFISILMLHCSEDENNEKTPDEVWEVTAITTANSYDLNGDGTASTQLLQESSCTEYYQTLTLRSDNSGTMSFTSILIVYEGEELDTYESLCFNDQELYTSEVTWAKTESALIITDSNGQTNVGTIIGSQVVFSYPEGMPVIDTPEQNNIMFWEDIEITYTLQ